MALTSENGNPIRDICLGVAIGAFALWSVWQSNAFREIEANEPLGPAFLPLVLSAALFVLGLIVATRGLRTSRKRHANLDAVANSEEPDMLRLGASSLTFGVYVASLLYVNFYLATAVVVFALLWIAGSRSWTINISVSIAVNFFCYFVFSSLLGLPIANI